MKKHPSEIALLLTAGLLFALFFTGLFLAVTTDDPTLTIQSFKYTVKSGDTLWLLSDEFANSQDRMEWILEVMSRNQMENETIYAGKTIEVYTWKWEVE